jgi:hypothetical protein
VSPRCASGWMEPCAPPAQARAASCVRVGMLPFMRHVRGLEYEAAPAYEELVAMLERGAEASVAARVGEATNYEGGGARCTAPGEGRIRI